MALKALMLRKKINEAKKNLDALRAKDADFETREKDIETSIEEASTDEERSAVEEEIESFQNEKAEHEDTKGKLERQIADLEQELSDEEKAQDTEPEERKADKPMSYRSKFFGAMDAQRRDAIFASDEVKNYLGEVRSAIREKRAITNVGLTIPEVFLGLLRENIINYSKLYSRVHVVSVNGDGRQVIAGTIPEAVWTDCCANLNELAITFNDVEVNCWKVGGYFAVCNANLEDSDIDLAAELLAAIGQGIGLALDKAILYGTGSRMPLGIVTRLAQSSKPSGYSDTARAWTDLHTTNILSHNASVTGVDLIQAIIVDSGAAKGKYSRGEKTWVMNEATYTKIMASTVATDAAGNIVSGVTDRMPVVGGSIVVLSFVPDNVIIGGYFDLYLLAERAGQKFATSEHVRFLQDQTVMKGTARYDGQPSIAEGFVAIGINGVTPDASMTFASDSANVVDLASLTGLTLSPSFAASKTTYTATTTNASNAITALAQSAEASVKIYYTAGTTTTEVLNGAAITWAAGSGNVVKVVVSNGNSSKTYQITVTKN